MAGREYGFGVTTPSSLMVKILFHVVPKYLFYIMIFVCKSQSLFFSSKKWILELCLLMISGLNLKPKSTQFFLLKLFSINPIFFLLKIEISSLFRTEFEPTNSWWKVSHYIATTKVFWYTSWYVNECYFNIKSSNVSRTIKYVYNQIIIWIQSIHYIIGNEIHFYKYIIPLMLTLKKRIS